MTAQGRIAYAERKLAEAEREVVAAQRFLQSALEQSRYELDQADRELVRPGALIAEFDGKLYVSMARAGFRIERHCQDFVDRVITTHRTAELRCECGERTEWNLSPEGDIVAYRYVRNGSSAGPNYHLAIVRTPLEAPLCDDWLQLPLKLDPDA